MPDNGFYLRLEVGTATGLVVHGFELLHEQGTALYPSVEGLHCGFGTAVRVIEQSQFGLAIRTGLEHVFGSYELFLKRYKYTKNQPFKQVLSVLYCLYKDILGHLRTLEDIAGHCTFGTYYLCNVIPEHTNS